MKKSDIFNALIAKVCEVCEVREDLLLGPTKLQSVVDSRILAVQYLRRIGLSNDEIAYQVEQYRKAEPTIADIKKRAKTVQRLFDSYSQRCLESYAFCLMSKDIKDFCHETYSELYLSWMKQLPTK